MKLFSKFLDKAISEEECKEIDVKFIGDPKFSPNPRFFGRTDLWISLSRAKFDEEVDFEVRLGVALQK